MSNTSCLACRNAENNRRVEAQEMMYGTRERFQYVECSKCHSLGISSVPADLGKYYASDYYSFGRAKGGLRGYLKNQRLRHTLGCGGIQGAMVARIFGPQSRSTWMRLLPVSLEDRILDVGCGSGSLLYDLRSAGFKHLVGLDPFVREEVKTKGLRIVRGSLETWTENHEVVMMHHSFEHMADPSAVLANVRRILPPAGRALIRTPVAACFAWRHYGAHWVQLDAPRHLFIPSVEGMKQLAERAGLKLERVEFDSTDFQFWGSELYQRGISLQNVKKEQYFDDEQLKTFRQRAEELNRKADGDSGCFLLRKE
ncbi:MAG TPA: class I SAM-dependent methyltransferase [Verrucomicrobiota bacterium]|nr:hypothetical protein [Verrucomicrobiales bacterium]HRI11373.1 class I SAM-dependent methyltransferase [Verrucomicrobiota bacterium]